MILCPQLSRLSDDHARWGAEVARLGQAAEPGASRELLRLWEEELLPHCRLEEEVLLPELTRQVCEADALVVFTLGDHVALWRLVRDLKAAVGPGRAAAAARLAERLEAHFAYEDRTLFPALQEALGCTRLAALGDELAAAGRTRKHRPVDDPPVAHHAAHESKGRTQ